MLMISHRNRTRTLKSEYMHPERGSLRCFCGSGEAKDPPAVCAARQNKSAM